MSYKIKRRQTEEHIKENHTKTTQTRISATSIIKANSIINRQPSVFIEPAIYTVRKPAISACFLNNIERLIVA